MALRSAVTFLVGENGSGKSTLLEAIAECCGFHPEGGNRDHHRQAFADRSALAQALRLSWQLKVTDGFFLRAESYYNFAPISTRSRSCARMAAGRYTSSRTANTDSPIDARANEHEK